MIDRKPIPGYPDYYATADGRIISQKRNKTRILKGVPAGRYREYLHVKMYVNGRYKCKTIHRLVCIAFNGSAPEGMEARHLDGDPSNNNASNLDWGTHRENMHDRITTKTMKTKLTEAEVRVIRKLRGLGVKLWRIAEIFDVSQALVCLIARRQIWTHV